METVWPRAISESGWGVSCPVCQKEIVPGGFCAHTREEISKARFNLPLASEVAPGPPDLAEIVASGKYNCLACGLKMNEPCEHWLAILDENYKSTEPQEAQGESEYSLDDYMNAPSGIGPLAPEWKDKPHRLIYDLVKRLKMVEPQEAEARNCTRCNAPQAFDTQTGWFRTKYCWTDPDAHLGAVRA